MNIASESRVGSTLGDRYLVESVVGMGSYGHVFRAFDLRTGSTVAIKEFDPLMGRSSGFLRELSVLFEIRHPRIVRCESLFMEDRRRFLVYEFMEGGSLRDFLERPAPSIARGLGMIADAMEGVAQAHAEGFIHRDLKPENILLTLASGQPEAKVTDFGVAVLRSSQQRGSVGSPAYMAPEQFYDDHDYRVDIYAIGIVIYELVRGRRPFYGPPTRILKGHLYDKPHMPHWLSPRLKELLEACLAKAPDRRPESMNAVIRELRAIVAHESGELRQPGWPVHVGLAGDLLVTSDWVFHHHQGTLDRYDRWGRLDAVTTKTERVVCGGDHLLALTHGEWRLQTPLGERSIPGIPLDASVAVSPEADVIYVHNGAAHLIQRTERQTITVDTAIIDSATFVGPSPRPWLIGHDREGWFVKTPERRIPLPGPVRRACGHTEREEMVVADQSRLDQWYLVTPNAVRPFQAECKRMSCDGSAFLAGGCDGRVLSIRGDRERIAETRLDVSVFSACDGRTAWIDNGGDLSSMSTHGSVSIMDESHVERRSTL